MSVPNEMFSGYLIQYCIWRVHFFSNLFIRFSV